jgi:O-antigen ligase
MTIFGMMRRGAAVQLTRKLLHPVFLWLCAYVVIQAISVHYSGVFAMLEELDFWSTYAIFVAVSLLLITDVAQLYRFIAGTLAGSAVVIGYGLVAVATDSPALEGNRAGAYGMYQNHNDYSFIILMALPYAYLSVGLAKSRSIKLLLVSLVLACIVGTVFSLSRGGIIALVVMLTLLYWRTTSGGIRTVGIVVLVIIGSLGIVYQFAAREENQLGHYTAEDAKTSRYELWRAARRIIEKRPILGVGSGRFREHAAEYAELSHNNIGKVTHNTYLEVATGSGLLGFTSFLMILWGIIKASTEKWGASISGVPPPIRAATQICILTIILRAMLDAKAYDWSFYFLAVMAIVIATLQGGEERPVSSSQAAPARKIAVTTRPAVYGRKV